MIEGLRPSSSNTSSIRMWASPRAPPPPSASPIEGRTTGSVVLRTCRALPGGFIAVAGDVMRLSFPPPLWGRDREGGIAEHLRSGFPPPLTPPHKGEGNPRAALLSREQR